MKDYCGFKCKIHPKCIKQHYTRKNEQKKKTKQNTNCKRLVFFSRERDEKNMMIKNWWERYFKLKIYLDLSQRCPHTQINKKQFINQKTKNTSHPTTSSMYSHSIIHVDPSECPSSPLRWIISRIFEFNVNECVHAHSQQHCHQEWSPDRE